MRCVKIKNIAILTYPDGTIGIFADDIMGGTKRLSKDDIKDALNELVLLREKVEELAEFKKEAERRLLHASYRLDGE